MLAPSGAASPFALRAWASTKRNELGRASGRKHLIFLRREQKAVLSLACRRATHFSLLAQRKVSKRKGLPDGANPASHSFRDFSTRHPGSVEKRRPSVGGALRVCRRHGLFIAQDDQKPCVVTHPPLYAEQRCRPIEGSHPSTLPGAAAVLGSSARRTTSRSDARPQSTEIPASFCNASAYRPRVRSMTSAGSLGPGAVLSQSSVSR